MNIQHNDFRNISGRNRHLGEMDLTECVSHATHIKNGRRCNTLPRRKLLDEYFQIMNRVK